MMGLEAEIDRLSRELGEALQARGWFAATAESCTGGGVATAITDIAGSSGWFDRGFVTYTNEAKQQMLGVSIDSLLRHGAVSEAVVLEMARGGLARSDAGICVAISGIAGPGGGSDDKPVGTVWFAWRIARVAINPCSPASMATAIRCASRRSDRPCPDCWPCSDKLGLILYA